MRTSDAVIAHDILEIDDTQTLRIALIELALEKFGPREFITRLLDEVYNPLELILRQLDCVEVEDYEELKRRLDAYKADASV